MQIVADAHTPFVEEAFAHLGTVQTKPGRAIGPEDVRNADVLLVRSITPIHAKLLDGSTVQFVGTATIGTDHVDLDYLQECGIRFASAPGSNADAVVEYVLAALLHMAVQQGTTLRGKTVGIIGHGNIGRRLARRLPAFGLTVLLNDPPLARIAEAQGTPHPYRPLEEVLEHADILTVHTPLIRSGSDATFHLIDEARLRTLKPDAWLVNASRGAVIDNDALVRVLKDGHLGAVILDVWEHEPTPNLDLLRRVDLATVHIAGHSFDGKVAGTVMLYDAVTDAFDQPKQWNPETVLAPTDEDHLTLTPPDAALPESEWLHALVRQAYPIIEDDSRMRELLALDPDKIGSHFAELRRSYPRRRTFDRFSLTSDTVPTAYRQAVEEGFRFSLTATSAQPRH